MEKPERIRQLQEKLYSRTTKDVEPILGHDLPEQHFEVKEDFEEIPIPKETFDTSPRFKIPLLSIILLLSIFFFIGAAGYASYSIFRGSNLVSADNIDIGISGPVSVPGGEKLSLDITILNRNRAPLRLAELIIDYPKGSRRADNLGVELTSERILVGDVAPGENVRKNITAVLFGEEKTTADIKLSLEYRLIGSNAIFSKDVPYDIVISSNPISLVVSSPKETISGQDLAFLVDIRSNSTEVIKNVLVKAEYPSGFSFQSANPTPLTDNKTWKLGDLPPGEERSITLRGVLLGENEDARVFRFETGIGSEKNEREIATPFAGFKQEISIKKPFIGLSIAINGDKDEQVVTRRDSPIRVDLSYINNLSVPVRDVSVTLNLSGLALDKNRVEPENGFYQSINNVVIWDKSNISDLANLAPGDSGTVSLTLTPKQNVIIQNPEIILTGNVNGRRIEEGNVPEEIVATVTRHIKMQSDVILSNTATYFGGPLSNTGPLPPKAEKETTYTITWNITNGSNDLTDTTVEASLPSYVRFLGEVTPSSEDVVFNKVGGIVTWNAGVVRAGVGFSQPSKTVSFKIGVTPSVTQIGETPIIVNETSLETNDRFTGTPITLTKPALTTRTIEAQSKNGDDIVVP
ncbi:MAG: hypothetical protein Q7S34_03940 [bacterium]|nr:hypothetical protein [bacterium]